MQQDTNKTKVKFLFNDENNDLFAFFYEDKYNDTPNLFTSYSHIGQHSSCHLDYANESRYATVLEYGDLLAELVKLGYNLDVFEVIDNRPVSQSVEFPEAKKLNVLKAMIIENFILYYTTDEAERQDMINAIDAYILEDHVQEILQGLNINEDKLGVHTTCQNCGASTNL